jgi:hypothetical protein
MLPILATVPTDLLRVGDVVLTHGMLCVIDHSFQSRDARYGRVFWTEAHVVNRDDVPASVVPLSFTPEDAEGCPRWTIQGNASAHWSVVARDLAPCHVACAATRETDYWHSGRMACEAHDRTSDEAAAVGFKIARLVCEARS